MGKGKRWNSEELDLLDDLIGRYPLRIIAKKINNWHRKNKTNITRTFNAVKVKVLRDNYSTEPTEDNMTITRWAKQLRISPHRVRGWTRFSGLVHQKVARNKLAISIKNMKDFACQKPFLFADISKDILLYYFGEKVTNQILASKPLRDKLVGNKQITRIDTGETYTSIREASRKTGIIRCTIKREAERDGWLKFVK